MNKVDLSKYDNSWYKPGPAGKRMLWYFVNILFFKSALFPVSGLKRGLLRLFGASIGRGVVIKPSVSIKYPWMLVIGDHCWIGEHSWIDNLAQVTLGSNVCISQGAYIFCGNHDFKKESFDLMVKPIKLEDGAWVGAKAVVCPGVQMAEHAILTAGSVATTNMEAFGIYQGNPAIIIKSRVIGSTKEA